MNLAKLNLTPEQLKVYTSLQKIAQAWTAMLWILILFTVGFVAFLYSIFVVKEQTLAKGIVGGIDTLLGFSLRAIIGHLFPKK